MIEFLKDDQEVKADGCFSRMDVEPELAVRYLLTCDGCGKTCLCDQDEQPNSILELMLQIDNRAWDEWDSEKRLSTEFCVLVKREPNKYPDYKILCPDCEGDPDCKFQASSGPDPSYVRLRDDACTMSDLRWEEWIVPQGAL